MVAPLSSNRNAPRKVVSRNVKCWRNGEIALRWTAAGMMEVQKSFGRLKAYRQKLIPRRTLQDRIRRAQATAPLKPSWTQHSLTSQRRLPQHFSTMIGTSPSKNARMNMTYGHCLVYLESPQFFQPFEHHCHKVIYYA